MNHSPTATPNLPARLAAISVVILIAFITILIAFQKDVERKEQINRARIAAERAYQQEQERLRIEAETRRLKMAEIQLHEQQLAALQEQLERAITERDEFKEKVNRYMKAHPQAVAAILAGALGSKAVLDENLRPEARTIGAIYALIALGWALEHSEELRMVADELSQATEYLNDLTTSITRLEGRVAEEKATISRLQSSLPAVP